MLTPAGTGPDRSQEPGTHFVFNSGKLDWKAEELGLKPGTPVWDFGILTSGLVC